MDKVIIGGVDVSECKHFYSDEMCDNEQTLSCVCVKNKECEYKQLKRLQAENETLERTNNELRKRFSEDTTKLSAELKKYEDMAKKGLEEFKDVGGCWGCGLQLQLNQDIEDIKKLKAENEKLNKMTGIFSARLCEKYRQCLQEIRDIILSPEIIDEETKKLHTSEELDNIVRWHREDKLSKIKAKINEVLGVKNV